MRINREYLRNEFLKIIDNSEDETNKDINLYIDVPFCLHECKYCMFAPIKLTNKKMYDAYFDYVLNYLDEMEEVLKKGNIVSVYFGGGTASLMSPALMKKIFDKIPNFKDIKHKAMEFHPSTITEEKLKLIIDNKFSFVSLGIQSFDKDLIKKMGRIPVNREKIETYIDILKKNNIIVSVDLLTCMSYSLNKEDYSKESLNKDLEILKADIQILDKMKSLPDQIILYTNIYYVYDTERQIGNRKATKEIIKIQRKCNRLLENTNFFFPEVDDGRYLDLDRKSKNIANSFQILLKNTVQQAFPYNCEVPKNNDPSLIAIGGLRKNLNHRPLINQCYGHFKNGEIYHSYLSYNNEKIDEWIEFSPFVFNKNREEFFNFLLTDDYSKKIIEEEQLTADSLKPLILHTDGEIIENNIDLWYNF